MSDWGGERLRAKTLKEVEKKSRERYEYAKKFCKGKKVLDAACGCGYGSYILSKVAKAVLGVDYSKEAIEFAKKHWAAKNTSYRCFDLEGKLAPLGKFDVIVSLETIEHLNTAIPKTCESFRKILSPGGILILSHPEKEKKPKKRLRDIFKSRKPMTFHKHFNIHGKTLKKRLVKLGFEVINEWFQPPRFYYHYHVIILKKK